MFDQQCKTKMLSNLIQNTNDSDDEFIKKTANLIYRKKEMKTFKFRGKPDILKEKRQANFMIKAIKNRFDLRTCDIQTVSEFSALSAKKKILVDKNIVLETVKYASADARLEEEKKYKSKKNRSTNKSLISLKKEGRYDEFKRYAAENELKLRKINGIYCFENKQKTCRTTGLHLLGGHRKRPIGRCLLEVIGVGKQFLRLLHILRDLVRRTLKLVSLKAYPCFSRRNSMSLW